MKITINIAKPNDTPNTIPATMANSKPISGTWSDTS